MVTMRVVTYVIDLLKAYIRQGCPCLFRSVTGLYCPGCGGTRALKFLLQGDILKSLWYHPLVGYMAAVAVVESVGWLWRRKREHRRKTGPEDSKRMDDMSENRAPAGKRSIRAARFLGHYEVEVYVGIGVAAVNWAVKNWALLMWGVELIP